MTEIEQWVADLRVGHLPRWIEVEAEAAQTLWERAFRIEVLPIESRATSSRLPASAKRAAAQKWGWPRPGGRITPHPVRVEDLESNPFLAAEVAVWPVALLIGDGAKKFRASDRWTIHAKEEL